MRESHRLPVAFSHVRRMFGGARLDGKTRGVRLEGARLCVERTR